ncbi:hypothetical protein KZP23_08555 [Echinicola marina]|uniref:MauE/DoxX family redox-associated membrane protein n=1 Tax=Echinicola marina TaxID=2859768 RepID=UPI001CF6FDF2|nr:MauE/DoxX family redox-associated membrane protein [Echinicola marina]UCS95045.1 hypothetical protein KZP23_08555 [Echinicola marina]
MQLYFSKSNFYMVTVILFILLWAYTGMEKLVGYNGFLQAMQNQTIPLAWARKLAYIILIVELVLTLMLMVRNTRKLGLLLSTLLITVFTTYIGLVWIGAFPRVPCSCAGFIESMSWEGHFLFNVGFIVLGVFGVMASKT